jgi:dienelactone hydrolase
MLAVILLHRFNMASVIVFHSVLGLRDIEHRISDHLLAAGHAVVLPDLYAGETTDDLTEGFAIQLHVSDNDLLFPQPDVDSWQSTAARLGANVEVFRYANAGHYFLDPVLSDYSEKAAAAAWIRITKFLQTIDSR